MAPIRLIKASSFGSHNPKFPADNLLSGKRWQPTCTKTNEATVELTFQNLTKIAYIDVGYFNIASIEIHACKSTSPSDYRTILSEVILQTATEARSGVKKVGCKMFKDDMLSPIVKSEKFDQIKIIVKQPHIRNKPFGIEFVRVASPNMQTIKSNVIETKKSPVETTPQDHWKQSGVGKLAQQLTQNNKISQLTSLEEKLFTSNISPDKGSPQVSKVMGRTAMMVLASRRKSSPGPGKLQSGNSPKCNIEIPKMNRESPKRKNYSDIAATLNHSSRNVSMEKSKTNNEQTASKYQEEINHGKDANILPKSSPNETTNHNGIKIQKQNFTHQKDSNSLYSNGHKSKFLTNKCDKLENIKDETTTVGSAKIDLTTDKNEETINDSIESIKSSSSGLPEPNDVVGNQNAALRQEIRGIKKQVKEFFNKLDMETVDVSQVTLKELRHRFERQVGIKLDKGGREYFRKITSRFLQIMSTRGKAMKRKSDGPSNSEMGVQSPAKTRKIVEDYVECPICMKNIPKNFIILHADGCMGVEEELKDVSVRETTSSDLDTTGNDIEITHAKQVLTEPEIQHVACPLCSRLFSPNEIAEHADNCAEISMSQNDSDVIITESSTSATDPPLRPIHRDETIINGDESMLSDTEKLYWEKFRNRPKPFSRRLNTNSFDGEILVKCPTCGQYYKKSEIEDHSDECADKVNSGMRKHGLYFVKDRTTK